MMQIAAGNVPIASPTEIPLAATGANEAGGSRPPTLPPGAMIREMPRPGDTRHYGHTVASTPAAVSLHWLQYLRCAPVVLACAGACLGVGLALLFVHRLGAAAMVFAAFYLLWTFISENRRKFRSGDLCAAVVISPELIATYTNMDNGNGPRPAVRIDRVKLSKLTGGPFEVGDRLPMVSLYQGDRDKPAWTCFDPTPIGAGTRKPEVVSDTLARIPRELWNDLERGLAQVPHQRPGLYRLWESADKMYEPFWNKKGRYLYAGLFFLLAALFVLFKLHSMSKTR